MDPVSRAGVTGRVTASSFLPFVNSTRLVPVLREDILPPLNPTRVVPVFEKGSCPSSIRCLWVQHYGKGSSFFILVKSTRGVPVLGVLPPVNPTRVVPVFEKSSSFLLDNPSRVVPALRKGFFLPHPRQINAWGSSARDPPTRQPNACGSSIREGFLPVFNSMRVGPVLRKGFFLPHPRQIDA